MTTPIPDEKVKNIKTILEILLHQPNAKKFPNIICDQLEKTGLFKSREDAEKLLNLTASGTFFEKYEGSPLARELENLTFNSKDLFIDGLNNHPYLDGPFRRLYLYTCIIFAFHHQLNILSVEKTELFDLFRQYAYQRQDTSNDSVHMSGRRNRLKYCIVPYYKDSILINTAVKLFFTRYRYHEGLTDPDESRPINRQIEFTRVMTNHAEKLFQAAIMTCDLESYSKFLKNIPEIQDVNKNAYHSGDENYYFDDHENNLIRTIFYPFLYLMLLSKFNQEAFKGINGNILNFNKADKRDYGLGPIVPTDIASTPKKWQMSVSITKRGLDSKNSRAANCKEYVFERPNEEKYDLNKYKVPVSRKSQLPLLFQPKNLNLSSANNYISFIELKISKMFDPDAPVLKRDRSSLPGSKDNQDGGTAQPPLDDAQKLTTFCKRATEKLELGADKQDLIQNFLHEEEFGWTNLTEDLGEEEDSMLVEHIVDETGKTGNEVYQALIKILQNIEEPAVQEKEKKEEEKKEENWAGSSPAPLQYASSLRLPLSYASELYFTQRAKTSFPQKASEKQQYQYFLDQCAHDPRLPDITSDKIGELRDELKENEFDWGNIVDEFRDGDDFDDSTALDLICVFYDITDEETKKRYFKIFKEITKKAAVLQVEIPVEPRLSPSICNEPPGMYVYPDNITYSYKRYEVLSYIRTKFYAAPEDSLPLEQKDFFIEICKKHLLKSFIDKRTRKEILKAVDEIYFSGLSWQQIGKDLLQNSAAKKSILVDKVVASLNAGKKGRNTSKTIFNLTKKSLNITNKNCHNILSKAYQAALDTASLDVKCMNDCLETFMYYAAKHEDISFVDAMYLIMIFEKIRRAPENGYDEDRVKQT